MLLYAALVFVAAVATIWLLLFPATLDRVWAWVSKSWGRVGRGASRAGQRLSVRADHSDRAIRGAGARLGEGLRRHWLVIVAATALVILPPVIILVTRDTVVLEGFTREDLSESRTLVAQLLRGERLRPPPPPPPELFTTAEVFRLKPEIVNADRRWESVNPDLQQRVLAIHEVMRRQYGIEMVLVEGYRSPERQAELMREGRATRAGAWQSCHQYGLAVDSAPIRDGKLQWDMGDEWTRKAYFLYGDLAVQTGLEWGGNWRSLKDYVHVEMASECGRARATKRAELAKG